MSASHFMGINQIIIEIFCSGLKCWTDRPANIAIPGNTLLMWQLLDAKQPNKKSNLTLALQSLITLFVIQFSPHLCGSFSRRSYMSLNIKTVLQVADEEERINVWLKPTQITWYLFEMITSALGIDGFCAVWPFDCTDMWRAISVRRGRETTPSRIVPRRGVSWNWKIQRQWQRGTEHQHTTMLKGHRWQEQTPIILTCS